VWFWCFWMDPPTFGEQGEDFPFLSHQRFSAPRASWSPSTSASSVLGSTSALWVGLGRSGEPWPLGCTCVKLGFYRGGWIGSSSADLLDHCWLRAEAGETALSFFPTRPAYSFYHTQLGCLGAGGSRSWLKRLSLTVLSEIMKILLTNVSSFIACLQDNFPRH
jgi:hypothetical protein